MEFPDVEKPAGGGGAFLKLEDGESVRGVFQGKIRTLYVRWNKDTSKNEECGEKDAGAKVRFRINFIAPDKQSKELVAKIFEFPWDVFADLKSINEDSPLEKTKVKITRFGLKKDTRHQIMPILGKEAITEAQLAMVENVKLLPLEKVEEGQNDGAPMPGSDDIPF